MSVKERKSQRMREWHKQHPEYIKLHMRKYRKEHPEYRQYIKDYREKRRAENPSYCSDSSRKWQTKHPDKVRLIHQRYKRNHPEIVRNSLRRYAIKHPEKIKARRTVRRKPCGYCCLICGSTENLNKHHPDYSKPKEIITLCRKCHIELHQNHLAYKP